jgi:hypothetical protein
VHREVGRSGSLEQTTLGWQRRDRIVQSRQRACKNLHQVARLGSQVCADTRARPLGSYRLKTKGRGIFGQRVRPRRGDDARHQVRPQAFRRAPSAIGVDPPGPAKSRALCTEAGESLDPEDRVARRRHGRKGGLTPSRRRNPSPGNARRFPAGPCVQRTGGSSWTLPCGDSWVSEKARRSYPRFSSPHAVLQIDKKGHVHWLDNAPCDTPTSDGTP